MDLLNHYFTAVEKAVYAASNGCDATHELSLLAPLQAELRSAFDSLLLRPDPIVAAARRSELQQQKRDNEMFYLSWRIGAGEEPEQVIGREALAKRLSLKPSSVDVYLSRGKGAFTLKRHHPTTLERDQLSVVTATPAEAPKQRRGRPRKGTRDVEFM